MGGVLASGYMYGTKLQDERYIVLEIDEALNIQWSHSEPFVAIHNAAFNLVYPIYMRQSFNSCSIPSIQYAYCSC